MASTQQNGALFSFWDGSSGSHELYLQYPTVEHFTPEELEDIAVALRNVIRVKTSNNAWEISTTLRHEYEDVTNP